MGITNIGKAAAGKVADGLEKVGSAAFTAAGLATEFAVGTGEFISRGLEYNPKFTDSIFRIKFTKPARHLMYAGGFAVGLKEAYEDYRERQMGVPSGEVVGPTPRISYTRFGEEMGATGDLVFAMNRNRRG